MRNRPCRGASRLRLATTMAGLAATTFFAIILPAGAAQSEAPAPAFSGTAAATGTRLLLTVPGAPGTDVPLDGGGPAAEVAVDSIGTSIGYAAFPDPGRFAVSIPGTLSGLLTSGAGGAPPVPVSLPEYPFYVTSDATTKPDASFGSGPAQLRAHSEARASDASATTGEMEPEGAGAGGRSAASVAQAGNGAVVSQATSELKGFAVGPLTIGEVRSRAIMTLEPGGRLVPSSELSVTGLRVGDVAVTVDPEKVAAGPAAAPLPLNETLATTLEGSGITATIARAQLFPERVIAPALEITLPLQAPVRMPDGTQRSGGTLTIKIGAATASMSRAPAEPVGLGDLDPELPAPAAAEPAGTSLAGPGPGSIPFAPGAASAPTGATPSGGFGAGSGPVIEPADGEHGPRGAPSAPAVGSELAAGTAAPVAFAASVSLRSLYVVAIAGALLAMAVGQLVRRLGGSHEHA